MKRGLSCLVGFVISFFALPWANAATKEVKVAVLLRFGDEFNNSTKEIARGIASAVQAYKHQDLKITLVPYQHGTSLDDIAKTSAQVVKDGIRFVIGGEQSNEAAVMADIFERGKVIFITPTSTNPSVTRGRLYVFRGCFSDDAVAAALAAFTIGQQKVTKLGILHNLSYPYTDYLASSYEAAIKKAVPKITMVMAKILRGQVDYKQDIQRMKVAGVTHVAALTYDGDLFRFVAQAAAADFFPTYVGSDGWGDAEGVYKSTQGFNKGGAKHFLGFGVSYWNQDVNNGAYKALSQAYRRQFGGTPTAWTVLAFDTATILFAAIAKADGDDVEKVRDRLRHTVTTGLITSRKFQFDDQNTPRKDIHLNRIDDSGTAFYLSL